MALSYASDGLQEAAKALTASAAALAEAERERDKAHTTAGDALDEIRRLVAALAEARQEIAAKEDEHAKDIVALLRESEGKIVSFREAYDRESQWRATAEAALASLRAEHETLKQQFDLAENAASILTDELAKVGAEHETLRTALVKVRAHTSYTIPASGKSAALIALLSGLLQSIERITDAALLASPQDSPHAR
jgi:chromosome segregation ATPase